MTAELPLQNASSLWQPKRDRAKLIQNIVKFVCGAFAAISILTSFGIVGTLIFDTLRFFQEIPLWNFLTDTKWTPLFSSKQFGIFVLISATVLIAFIAILVAIPLGLLSAIFLSEYASPQLRRILKPLLEILAAIEEVTGEAVQVAFEPGRVVDVARNVLDISLAKQALNWRPEVSLLEGLHETADWWTRMQAKK